MPFALVYIRTSCRSVKVQATVSARRNLRLRVLFRLLPVARAGAGSEALAVPSLFFLEGLLAVPQFRKSDPPPPPAPARIWAPPQGRSDVILLATHLGKWIHWTGKRAVLCEGDTCAASRHRLPCRWIGYYPAVIAKRGKVDPSNGIFSSQFEQIVFTVNPEQQQVLEPYHRFPLLLTVNKTPKERSLIIEKVREIPSKKGLPEPFDVYFVVCRAFGIRPSQNGDADQGEEKDGD